MYQNKFGNDNRDRDQNRNDRNDRGGRKDNYRPHNNRRRDPAENGPFRKKSRNFRPKNIIKFENKAEQFEQPKAIEIGKLRVVPLGGLEYIGINTMCIEYGNDMIIVDMGMGFPKEHNGVDYVIPNYSYVKNNLEKLRGVIITHGHLDHIGAIPYVYKDLGSPLIYAGKLAAELIKEKASEFALEDSLKIQEVTSVSRYNLGVFEISYFRVNHNIPDSYGCIIRTPVGNIVHTGDFKFDLTPYREPVTEFPKLASIGIEGVLLLCSDSTNACRPGWSDSESSVTHDLTTLISEAKGRVITSTFSTLITRMAQIVEIAHAANRKVVMSGRSIESTVRIAKELGLIKVPWEAFITSEQAKYTSDDNLLILATGSQGEEKAALSRMVSGSHNDFDIKEGDTVILSSSFIPGNEGKINEVIGKLSKKGAHVYHSQMMDVHATGHAHAEDHKLLIHLCKPKYLMPVHGEYIHLIGQRDNAIKIGMAKENIIISENGMAFDFDEHIYAFAGKVDASPVLVDGNMMGDITPQILADREQLGDDGILVAVIMGEHINIVTRGFIEVKENQSHIDAVKSIVKNNMDKPDEIISKSISDYIREKIGREPIVVTTRKNLTEQ